MTTPEPRPTLAGEPPSTGTDILEPGADGAAGAAGVDSDPDSPWSGIPAVLLDGTHSYDPDTAGGCG